MRRVISARPITTPPARRRPGLVGLIALAAVGLLATTGCNSPRTTARLKVDALQETYAGKFDEARATINGIYECHLSGEPDEQGGNAQGSESIDSKHELVWRMERGELAWLAGDYQGATDLLNPAVPLIDYLRATSIQEVAGTVVANDTVTSYQGEFYEHTQVDYLRALSYLMLAEISDGTYTPPAAIPGSQPPPPGVLLPLPPVRGTDGVVPSKAYENAVNAARRMTIQTLTEAKDAGGKRYEDDPFARFFAGAVVAALPRATETDLQFADVMLDKAVQGYPAQYVVMHKIKGGFYEAPATAPAPVTDLFWRYRASYDPAGYREQVRARQGIDPSDTARQPWILPSGQGSVLVLLHDGTISRKETLDIRIVSAQGTYTPSLSDADKARGYRSRQFSIAGIAFWAEGPGVDVCDSLIALPLPGNVVSDLLSPGGLSLIGFALPVHAEDARVPPQGRVAAVPVGSLMQGAPTGTFQVVADLDAYARATLRDRQGGIFTRTIIRAAAKQAIVIAATREAKKKDEGLGLLIGLIGSAAATFSEVADTRCWTNLPDNISATLINLPAGEHDLFADLPLGGGTVSHVFLGRVRVTPGRTIIVPFRTMAPQAAPNDP